MCVCVVCGVEDCVCVCWCALFRLIGWFGLPTVNITVYRPVLFYSILRLVRFKNDIPILISSFSFLIVFFSSFRHFHPPAPFRFLCVCASEEKEGFPTRQEHSTHC